MNRDKILPSPTREGPKRYKQFQGWRAFLVEFHFLSYCFFLFMDSGSSRQEPSRTLGYPCKSHHSHTYDPWSAWSSSIKTMPSSIQRVWREHGWEQKVRGDYGTSTTACIISRMLALCQACSSLHVATYFIFITSASS